MDETTFVVSAEPSKQLIDQCPAGDMMVRFLRPAFNYIIFPQFFGLHVKQLSYRSHVETPQILGLVHRHRFLEGHLIRFHRE